MVMNRRRGFTLIEAMVAVVIGAITVVVASQVARMLVRQAASGRQTTDFAVRARVIGRQLRSDLRLAGLGSTGAVTADATNAPWATLMNVTTPFGGYRAMPAVAGANSAAGPVPVLPGSDAIMMIVPNPARIAQSGPISTQGGTVINMGPLANLAVFNGCQFLYIVDHSTPTGQGRAQIANFAGVAGTVLNIAPDALQFSVQPGSDVMCARISTYWVSDDDGDGLGDWLHRSDLQPNSAPVNIGTANQPVFLNPGVSAGNRDAVAPGVLDMQIAYAFSSELFGGAFPPTPAGSWAFGNPPGAATGLVTGAPDGRPWFEVRMVRLNILAKKMRALDTRSHTEALFRREDLSTSTLPPLNAAILPDWITTTEALTNLRYFDLGAPVGVPAEPM